MTYTLFLHCASTTTQRGHFIRKVTLQKWVALGIYSAVNLNKAHSLHHIPSHHGRRQGNKWNDLFNITISCNSMILTLFFWIKSASTLPATETIYVSWAKLGALRGCLKQHSLCVRFNNHSAHQQQCYFYSTNVTSTSFPAKCRPNQACSFHFSSFCKQERLFVCVSE